jgi:hypothetical protein
MNQWFGDNRLRNFPLVDASPLPLTAIVGAQFVLSNAFASQAVVLTSIVRVGTAIVLIMAVQSTTYPGYVFVGTFSTLAPEEVRVPLQLYNASNVLMPDMGYGFLYCGRPADLASQADAACSVAFELATVKFLHQTPSLSLRVANAWRPGASLRSEVVGAPNTALIQERIATLIPGCVEVTTAPDPLQRHMDPDVTGAATTSVPVPDPTITVTAYVNGPTTVITTRPITVTDAIPTAPAGFDAVAASSGPVGTQVTAGHNTVLSGKLAGAAQAELVVGYHLHGGTGIECSGVSGYLAYDTVQGTVKSVNGLTPEGELTIVGGDHVQVLPDPGGHRVLLLLNAENLQRAAP